MPKSIYIDENGNEQILSSSPSALSGLLDTDITTPTANQVLAYDNNGKVVNHNLATVAESGSYSDLTDKPTFKTYVYPISKATVNPSTWIDINIPIKTGDIVIWTLSSTATTGAFTTVMKDSSNYTYLDGAPYHSQYNTPNVVGDKTMIHDGTLNIKSYTNSATTFDNCAITVIRKV